MEDNLSHDDEKDLIKDVSREIENQNDGQTNNQFQEKSNPAKNKTFPPMLFPTYKKRPGTNDAGKEFEYVMCALYVLKLCTNKDIVDFKMTTNNEKYGDFDDICLQIENGHETKTFLLQLKHKENEDQYVTNQKLTSPKSEFTLTKYLKSFEELNVGQVTCLVYTNSPAKLKNGSNFNISSKEEPNLSVTVKKSQTLEFLHLLQNKSNSGVDDDIFQFDISEEKTFLKVKSFCENFFLMTGQDNVKLVKETVRKLLMSLLKVDIYDSFILFMKEWWSGRFVLTKRDVISKLVELAMSPWIQTVSSTNVNYKTKLLSNGIMNFEMTVVKNANNNIINNIWENKIEEFELWKAAQMYHIQENQNKRSKILWFLDKVPLIVKVDTQNEEQVKQSVKLLECLPQKKKLILVGIADFPNWKVLENLKDLYSSRDIYEQIIRDFRISLQGRSSINLEELIRNGEDFVDAIEMDDLLKMTQCEWLKIGSVEHSLPESYIPRKVSGVCVNTTNLLNGLRRREKNVVIINCSAEYKKTLNTRHALVMELDEFLGKENLDKFRNLILLSIHEPCPYSKFESVRKKLDTFQIYLFQTVDKDCFIRLMDAGDKELLRRFTNLQIDETEIYNCFKNQLNVIFAPPGMGKSTYFNVLSGNCPRDLWVVYVKLIDYNSSLDTLTDEQFLRHFMKKDEGSLSSKISNIYLKNKKILVLLDGIDELESQNVNLVLNRSKILSSQGFHVWMSSRENWQEKISKDLKFYTSVDMIKLTEDEQKLYIEKRLKVNYNSSNIEEIVDAIFKSSDIANSRQLLGIPLQLYIITENFLTDENLVRTLRKENIFVLTTMYRFFFEGKKKFHFKKIGVEERPELLGFNFEHHLRRYELPALRVCLDDQAFHKLNLNEFDYQEFVDDIKTKGDKFGIIKYVTSENITVFYHQTYAEYFACVWFARNLGKVKLLGEEWFSEKYQNLRLMFDIKLSEESPLHLAVIYSNKEQFQKYVDSARKDEVRRDALYLACCHGRKYPLPEKSEDYSNCQLERESEIYAEIVHSLVDRCHNIFQEDTLFGMNYVEYALNSRCLFVIEACLERKLLCFGKIEKLLQKYYKLETLAFYAAQMNYVYLLQNVLKTIDCNVSFSYYGSSVSKQTLLYVAIVGSRGQSRIVPKVENVESVKEILKQRHRKQQNTWVIGRIAAYFSNEDDLEDSLENGQLLRLTCVFGYYEIMRIILAYQSTCDDSNILHMTVEYGTLNDEVLELAKTIGLDVNQKNRKGETPLYLACKKGNDRFVKQLLDAGAEIDVRNRHQKENVFHVTAKLHKENIALMKRLLNQMIFEEKSTVNIPDKYGIYPLLYACERCHINYVQILLQRGAGINVTDRYGSSALHYVVKRVKRGAKNMCMDLLNVLIENGANLNLQNRKGETPLHLAVKYELWNLLETLLNSGADVNVMDNEGMPVLHYIACSGDAKIIKLLVDNGVNLDLRNRNGQTPLYLAATNKLWDKVETLLDFGADINVMDNEGMTLLHHEVKEIKLLVDNGVNLNVRNKEGKTALHLAFEQRNYNKVKALLEFGADANVADDNKENILHHAMRRLSISEDIPKIFLSNNVNINAQNVHGESPLHLACQYHDLSVVRFLLENGANENLITLKGRNMLHYAAESWCNYNIAELLQREFEKNARDVNGTSILHCACRSGRLSNIAILISSGADIHATDKKRQTILHYAAMSPHPEENVMKYLVETGVNIYAINSTGRNALDVAFENKCFKALQLLIETEKFFDSTKVSSSALLCYSAFGGCCHGVNYLIENIDDISELDRNIDFPLKFLKSRGKQQKEVLLKMTKVVNSLIEEFKTESEVQKRLVLQVSEDEGVVIEDYRNYLMFCYDPSKFVKYTEFEISENLFNGSIYESIVEYHRFIYENYCPHLEKIKRFRWINFSP